MKRIFIVLSILLLGVSGCTKPLLSASASTSASTIFKTFHVSTLNHSDIDYDELSVRFNGELLTRGGNDAVKGFEICPDRLFIHTNRRVVPGNELGVFSYLYEDWDGSSLYVRAFLQSEGQTVYGSIVPLHNQYVAIESAHLAVLAQDFAAMSQIAAANACGASKVGGFSDWRLPTQTEIFTLYSEKDNIGGFSEAFYWTSEMADSYHNYSMSFADGSLWSVNGNHRCRCVRSMSL